jgi:hypothetical protein
MMGRGLSGCRFGCGLITSMQGLPLRFFNTDVIQSLFFEVEKTKERLNSLSYPLMISPSIWGKNILQ